MFYYKHQQNKKPYCIKDYNANMETEAGQLSGNLRSLCGKEIRVIKGLSLFEKEVGIFRVVILEINGKHHTGDVVFTKTLLDWYKLDMHLNRRYNRVILHVTFIDDTFNLLARLQNGKRVPTVILPTEI